MTAQGDRHGEHELGVFVLGLLPPAEEQAVAAHVAECARCRDEADQLREVRALLDRLDESSIAQLREVPVESAPVPGPRPQAAAPPESDRAHHRPPRASGLSGPPRPPGSAGPPKPPGPSGPSGPPKRPARWRAPRSRVVLAALVVTLAVGVGLGSWLANRAPVDIRLAGTQSDSQTGVSVSVTVVPAPAGAHVDATVRGLVEGEAYRLYAVGDRGDSQVAAAWVAASPVEGVAGDITIPTNRLTAVTLTRSDDTVLLTVRLTPSEDGP